MATLSSLKSGTTARAAWLLASVLALPLPAWSQVTTPATNVPTQAFVMAPLTITAASTLSFGAFIAGSTAGAVIIAPTGVRNFEGGVRLASSNVGAASTITVVGTEKMTFTVNFPGSDVELIDAVKTNTMKMNTFTTNLNGETPTGTIPASGVLNFQIGAKLNVSGSQAPGTYTGNLPITITYN